uniref:Uncharacterized protein n=1 Tax=Rhizophora mucronata TaxID=61149 RepID=A0A2P2NWP6_RHIMU
MKFSCCYANCK